jgi:exopolyphosphatase/guanosine-5'-triphosphate,3'-diphosphate pyrophosphatase
MTNTISQDCDKKILPPPAPSYNHYIDCNAHHPVIAAIDLGTNSCRLLVVRINIAATRSNYFRLRPKFVSWRVLDSYAKVVGLGEGLHESNYFSDDAINRTVDALAACRRKLDRYYLQRMRIVATEACRRAENVGLLVQRVREELNFDIEVISSKEEANLALQGCSPILNTQIPYAIVFDIGGGSTEVVWLRLNTNNKKNPYDVIDSISLPFGVVTSSEALQQATDPQLGRSELLNNVKTILQKFYQKNNIDQYIENQEVQVLGSSGTVTTLAAIHLALPQYERKMVDGLQINRDDMFLIVERILNMSRDELLEHQYIGFRRVDFIITGSIILKGICEIFPAPWISVADRGVREGILVSLVRDLTRMRH